jgi:hypothetical protein
MEETVQTGLRREGAHEKFLIGGRACSRPDSYATDLVDATVREQEVAAGRGHHVPDYSAA